MTRLVAIALAAAAIAALAGCETSYPEYDRWWASDAGPSPSATERIQA